jgi:hypothetical protein
MCYNIAMFIGFTKFIIFFHGYCFGDHAWDLLTCIHEQHFKKSTLHTVLTEKLFSYHLFSIMFSGEYDFEQGGQD